MVWVWHLSDSRVTLLCNESCPSELFQQTYQRLSESQNLSDNANYVLEFHDQQVALRHKDGPEAPLMVDFITGALAHRRKFGGGKNQDIAKAVGINKGVYPSVLDATAGLGRDAFVLASLGCKVVMQERSPVVFALLADGLRRAQCDGEVSVIASLMSVQFCSSILSMDLNAQDAPEVIYLDPMFPERNKSALVKKDMRFFHDIVGSDEDSDQLLPVALDSDCARVVVKRPCKAPFLNGTKPSHQIIGKSIRYDIYVKRKIKGAP